MKTTLSYSSERVSLSVLLASSVTKNVTNFAYPVKQFYHICIIIIFIIIDTSRKQTLKKTADSYQEILSKFIGMANELSCRSISLPDIYICNNKGQRDTKKTSSMFLTAVFKFLADTPRSSVKINVFRIKADNQEFVKSGIKRFKKRV